MRLHRDKAVLDGYNCSWRARNHEQVCQWFSVFGQRNFTLPRAESHMEMTRYFGAFRHVTFFARSRSVTTMTFCAELSLDPVASSRNSLQNEMSRQD